MPNLIAMTPEAAVYVANLLRATRRDVIEWEEAQGKASVVASLGDGYAVQISEVPDFDNQDSDSPDYILTLLLHGDKLFALDRRVVDDQELTTALGEEVPYSHKVFEELWRRACSRAYKVTEHLNRINRTLEVKMRAG